ncbi:MAG: toxin C-terminal domain-containing protein [Gemmatimonadaceae bacterium]
MMDKINQGMADAFANLASKALELTAGAINAVSGLGDLYTAAGLNPNVQGTGDRVMAAAAAGMAAAGGAGDAARLTTSQGADLARYLGYESRVKDVPFNSHGQAVWTNGKTLLTLDVDAHSGGVWKMFDRQGNRLGTFGALLNPIGK